MCVKERERERERESARERERASDSGGGRMDLVNEIASDEHLLDGLRLHVLAWCLEGRCKATWQRDFTLMARGRST